MKNDLGKLTEKMSRRNNIYYQEMKTAHQCILTQIINDTLKAQWVTELPEKDRKKMVDAIYLSGGAFLNTLTLRADLYTVPLMLKKLRLLERNSDIRRKARERYQNSKRYRIKQSRNMRKWRSIPGNKERETAQRHKRTEEKKKTRFEL